MTTYQIESNSPAETHRLGARLGQTSPLGQIIALHGDLGAGKTAFTQGIAVGLGVTARVTSPTFTLINEYPIRGGLLVHIDCYRLSLDIHVACQEAVGIGLEDILAHHDAVVVIEWAERIAPLLPADHLQVTFVTFSESPDLRQISLTATDPASAVLLNALHLTGFKMSGES